MTGCYTHGATLPTHRAFATTGLDSSSTPSYQGLASLLLYSIALNGLKDCLCHRDLVHLQSRNRADVRSDRCVTGDMCPATMRAGVGGRDVGPVANVTGRARCSKSRE